MRKVFSYISALVFLAAGIGIWFIDVQPAGDVFLDSVVVRDTVRVLGSIAGFGGAWVSFRLGKGDKDEVD